MKLKPTKTTELKSAALRDVPAGQPFVFGYDTDVVTEQINNEQVYIRCDRTFVDVRHAGPPVTVCRLLDGRLLGYEETRTVTLVDGVFTYGPVMETK